MNILVIKQTSLGDVLHASGHIRAIKQRFPGCRLTLLTAELGAELYRHNPRIDEIVLYEHRRIKQQWRRHPLQAVRHIGEVIKQVRARRFALAFDLQGLGRSALFLYAARAGQKTIKGNWPGPTGFRNPKLHAIAEMDGVLKLAGVPGGTGMEVFVGYGERQTVDRLCNKINPRGKPLWVVSPFSRWQSKDWPLARFIAVAEHADDDGCVVTFTGDASVRARIDDALPPDSAVVNLAGELSLLEFAELVRRADLMLSGDSFPMHLACAQNTPVVALFGPTFESRTGPVGPVEIGHQVIRAPGCSGCDRPRCRRYCLGNLPVDAVWAAAVSGGSGGRAQTVG